MRTHQCGSYVSCVCAIAVRYGDDVVVIDMCHGGATVRFPRKKPLNPAMTVTRVASGNNFKVSTQLESVATYTSLYFCFSHTLFNCCSEFL